MTGRMIYLNGVYVEEAEARVSVFDRGFLMADAVYEVTCVFDGRLIDYDQHMARLRRSLDEMEITCSLSDDDLRTIHRNLIEGNGIERGMIYLQITRGNAGQRDFVYPDPATTSPTIIAFAIPKPDLLEDSDHRYGIRVITVPDLRWGRRDIKTVQLLYPSMVKMMAKRAGADDAWFVQDGAVTEGSASNAWIVSGNTLATRHLSRDILPGVTRRCILALAREEGFVVEERAFTLEEAFAADEAFITGAVHFAVPVLAIDDYRIGSGEPGPISRRLKDLYLRDVLREGRRP